MQKFIINTVIFRAASTFINFLVALLIARHAGPGVKGEVTLLITTVFFIMFFSNILGGQALVYLVPRNKLELLVIPAYLWSIVVSVISFVFLKLTPIHAEHISSIAILSFLASLITIHQTVLLAKKKIGAANLVQLIPLLLQLAGILLCFYFLHIQDAFAYIYSSLAAYAVTALVSFIAIRKQVIFSNFIKDFNWRDLKTPFARGLLFQLMEILQLINLRYYFYQLGLQQGSQYLGVYSIGISILEAVWIIPRSIATVHYVSTANSTEIKAETERTVQLTQLSFVLCLAALTLIYLVPSGAYTFVFGPGFSDVKHSVRFLFPGILIYSLWLVISSFYMGIGKYKELIISNITGAATLVLLSAWLIPKYVMSGAGLAATLSFTVATIVLALFFISQNKIRVSAFFSAPAFKQLLN